MRGFAASLTLLLLLISLLPVRSIAVSSPAGKILFDETLNEYWGGRIDAGYSDLAEELRSSGYTVESLKSGPITYEKLSHYDVFCIVAPFTPSQISNEG